MSGSFLRNGGRRAYQFLLERDSVSSLWKPHPRSFRSNLLSSKFRDSSASHITPPTLLPSASCSSVSSSVTRNGFVGWYLGMIQARPVLTKSLTAGAIFTAADISSQMMTLKAVDSLDLMRTSRMAGYGMLVSGPSLHLWFNTMSRFLPKRDILTTFKKMFLGQVLYGPIMTAVFFSINAALQGGIISLPKFTSKTLERYQKCCYTSQDASIVDHETQSWYQEVSKLKAKFESLQRSQRHFLGEDLGPLSVKELQQLECQLESALSQARQRKTQIMLDQMEELRKKERQLGEINEQLKAKLEAESATFSAIQGSWEADAAVGGNAFSVHHSQSSALDCEPTLQIGYDHLVQPEASIPRNSGAENNFMLGWVL